MSRGADPTAGGAVSIGFLHTSGSHEATFTELVAEVEPAAGIVHVVDPSLLADAAFGVDDALRSRVLAGLRAAADGTAAVVCTCSTIGGAAEALAAEVGVPVLRVDRPMIEAALAAGPRLALVAAIGTAVDAALALIHEVAAERDITPAVTVVDCSAAWEQFVAGDVAGYHRSVAQRVMALDVEVDAIVLAQASMAGALAPWLGVVPVLDSPRRAVEAALRSAAGSRSRGRGR